MHWYVEVLRKYAIFNGRAHRSEFWYFFAFNVVIAVALAMIDAVIRKITGIALSPLEMTYGLAVLVPGIAVSTRRLHDTNRSGWWLLLGLIPLVGLVLFIFMLEEGMPSSNRYGPDPRLIMR